MDRFLIQFLGLILVFTGIYFLGRNIVLVSSFYGFPAMSFILFIMAGILLLIFARRQTGNFGWALLTIGIILVFLNGRAVLQPISLINFVVAFTAFAVGFKLFNSRGIIRF
jgi:hypothetical protein